VGEGLRGRIDRGWADFYSSSARGRGDSTAFPHSGYARRARTNCGFDLAKCLICPAFKITLCNFSYWPRAAFGVG
jgi:hypothetical protein